MAVALLSLHPPQLSASEPVQTAKGLGFSFEYSAATFRSFKVIRDARLTEQENGTDYPAGIGPARVEFTLHQVVPAFAREKGQDSYTEATVVIVPLRDPSVPDFTKAYPDLAQTAEELRKILKAGVPHVAVSAQLPHWDQGDAEQTTHSKVQFVDSSWCYGIQYLTQEVQENTLITNERLVYLFQGLSKDGAYYLSVSIPVANPILSQQSLDVDNYTKEQMDAYFLGMEKRLNQAKDESFSPSLVELRALIQSLHPAK